MHEKLVGRSLAVALIATSSILLVTACDTMTPKSEPKAMTPIENTIEASATVEKLDLPTRLLTLKRENGEVVTVEVDPAVQNLPQVKVGDRVLVRYKEAIGASINATAAGQPVTVDLAIDHAKPGEVPRAQASSTTNIPVTITAVDTKSNHVSFSRAEDGLVRAITVESPQAKEFIKQLKPGDTVVITYTEALAISVEPAK